MTAPIAGLIAGLSLVAALFFLRFWRRTGDWFFALFAAAFAIDGLSRLVAAAIQPTGEFEPYAYVPRLVTFGLIIAAIVLKNRR
jgi:hypothetical protein